MSESKGWVHWHPDGYALDSNDFKVRSMDKAYVWSDLGAATEWDTEVSEECEVITYEEAVRRLAQSAMQATAEELRKEREAAPKPIVSPNMAPKAGISKPAEDRMLVEFRLDPSKYRVRVRPCGTLCRAFVQTREPGALIGQCTSDIATTAVGTAIECSKAPSPGRLLPHPWKRADGSHIKASWEE